MPCELRTTLTDAELAQTLDGLKDTPGALEQIEALKGKLSWLRLRDWPEKWAEARRQPWAAKIQSPSNVLGSGERGSADLAAGNQISAATYKADITGTQWQNGKMQGLVAQTKIRPESPESIAVGAILDSAEGRAAVGKFPASVQKAATAVRETFEKTADELGLEKKRYVKDYLSHIWNKDELDAGAKADLDAVAQATGIPILDLITKRGKDLPYIADTNMAGMMAKAQYILDRGSSGQGLLYEQLPQSIRFRFFETRTGALGYSLDAMKAVHTYVAMAKKKLFIEPMLQETVPLVKALRPELQPFAKEYLRSILGNREVGDPLSGVARVVKEVEFVRTMGFNPRTSIGNLFQQVPSSIEVGVRHVKNGWESYLSPAGRELFELSGHGSEVPTMFLPSQSPFSAPWQKLVSWSGVLFNKVETANRAVTYLGALSRWTADNAAKIGDTFEGMLKDKSFPAEAKAYADAMVRKTQFAYGFADMPMALRSPIVGAAFQFSSFPIKMLELMYKWGVREGPAGKKKLLAFTGIATGVSVAGDLAGVDLSGVSGNPVDIVEILRTFQSASQGDWDKAMRHAANAPKFGFRFGPAGGLVQKAYEMSSKFAEGEQVVRMATSFAKYDISPIMARRIFEIIDTNEQGGTMGEMVAQLLGFPIGDTVIRTQYMRYLDVGQTKRAKDLLDAYQKQVGYIPLNMTKAAEVRREYEARKVAREKELKGETPEDKSTRLNKNRIDRLLYPLIGS